MSLRSVFTSSDSDASSSSSGTATFSLTALIVLLAGWSAASGALLWFRRRIAPTYGARVKFNVVTGQPVYRGAKLRTLPTAEERREEAEAKHRPVRGPDGQIMHAQSASGESRLGTVCPRGCDDRFWCPPCLLECSCLDCLWCASCCGTPTCGEWMFLRVYRTQAARWIVLVMQILCLGINILALALNQWSLESDVAGTGLTLYAGVLGLRFNGSSVGYNCVDATGNMLMLCRTTLVASGCVFALGLLSSLLFFLSIGASMRMVCGIPYRLYTPGFAVVAAANAVSLTILLLLWGVVPHVVLRHVTDEVLDLKLGWSWGLFVFSWFCSILFTFYFRGAVESVTVQESGDTQAIQEAAEEERARADAERKLYAHPSLGDTYGLDQSLGVTARNKVFLVNPQQLELAERRAEAAQWTQEGYGSERHQAFVSPTAAYAQGFPTPRSLNPLGVSGPLIQPNYKANEPIPMPHVLEPTPQEAERMRWQLERDAAWRRAQADAARARREHRQLQGPFSATAPTYIDTAALDLAAEEASRADLIDLQDNGLDARTQQRIFGPQYGYNGAQLPRSLYSYGPDGEELPRGPARDVDLDASFRRGATFNQAPAVYEDEPEGSPASNNPASAQAFSPSGVEGQRPVAVAHQEDVEYEDAADPGVLPSASTMQFSRLDAAYVRNALPLSDAEMALLIGPTGAEQQQTRPKVRRVATARQQQQQSAAELPSDPVPSPSLARAPTSARPPPMTPKEYRDAVAADRAAQPNLLHPAYNSAPQRLPPLPRQPTYLPPLATPHYSYGPSAAPVQSWGGANAHPFALGSPHRESQQRGFDHDGRIYTYLDRAPSQYPRGGLPSTSSRGGGDLHFASTFSRLPTTANFAYSPAAGAGRQQQQHPGLQHQASALPPASPHFLSPLSVEVADGGQDPFNRTIPTPLPVVRYTADPTEPDEREELDRSHSRRIPLAPQTPRIVEAPGSAAVLRTPHSRRGPYSQAFAF